MNACSRSESELRCTYFAKSTLEPIECFILDFLVARAGPSSVPLAKSLNFDQALNDEVAYARSN